MQSSLTGDQQLIRIGVLVRTFGLGGDVRCRLDGEAIPELRLPATCRVGYSASFARELRLVRAERHDRDLICHFEGIDDQTAAQGIVDQALFLPGEAVGYDSPYADPRIIGHQVVGEDGVVLGSIEAIGATRAHYVWVIRATDGREWMLPAIPEFILELQSAEQRAVVRLIPGLLEEDEDGQERG